MVRYMLKLFTLRVTKEQVESRGVGRQMFLPMEQARLAVCGLKAKQFTSWLLLHAHN